MGLLQAAKWHYSSTHYERTPAQIKSEERLAPGVPFNRYFLMPAAVLIQVCCGSLYAWSGYNLPIERAIYGENLSAKKVAIDRGLASNVFFVAVAVFGCTAALLGPWLERNGPRKGAMIGSTLFFIGNLITALGVHVQSLALVFVGYGGIAGAGLGISYIAPVSPLQKWFPDLRGLAAGLAVCGFGAGSIFSPYTQKALIGPNYANTGVENLGVPKTFIILGACYFVVMMTASLVLRMPPPGYAVKGMDIHTVKGAESFGGVAPTKTLNDGDAALDKNESHHTIVAVPEHNRLTAANFSLRLHEALASREYILMYIMFLCNEATGLLIISKIQSITQNQMGQTADVAANINSALGGCNLCGRLIVPTLSDFLGRRKPFFLVSLCVQTLFLALLPGAIDNQQYGLFLTCAFVIAFFYGAGFGLIPAFLSDQFGSRNVGATHGVILTGWSAVSVCGGLVFNAVYKSEVARLAPVITQTYDLNFRWLLAFTSFGILVTLLVPTGLRDRRLPRKSGEWFRIRFFGRLVRVINGVPRVTSKADEDAEWSEYLARLQPATQAAEGNEVYGSR
ncbi:major facilitator superfamily domain-containing protein [Geranomyces variabilis]|nr:major facilitator superfamily domain-containing protein [Geranomyces variabilis]KAJ3134053.1 hypothetical protein HDU90_005401 [Geranomyces variabilis]